MSLNEINKVKLILERLLTKDVSGTFYLEVQSNQSKEKISRVLVCKNGRLIYAGLTVPNPQDFVKMLEQKLNREWVSSAVSVAMRQVKDQNSIRALLERLVSMQIFTWKQIETVVHTQIVLMLEQLLPCMVEFHFDSSVQLDICRGWELPELMLAVARREEQWSSLEPLIKSKSAIPQVQKFALPKVTQSTSQEVLGVLNHLQKWVDGQRSLLEIAQNLDKDPLQLAQLYSRWVQAGWIVMKTDTPKEETDLQTVLVVDDSALMQKLIKLSLTDHYRVLTASNAVDALSLLYHEKVALLLLDVSMPGMDGLELCRTVRNLSQLRELPIIMLTSRDKFFDKVKGRLAGATEYLTKPFDGEQLRQVVRQHLKVNVASEVKKIDMRSNFLSAT